MQVVRVLKGITGNEAAFERSRNCRHFLRQRLSVFCPRNEFHYPVHLFEGWQSVGVGRESLDWFRQVRPSKFRQGRAPVGRQPGESAQMGFHWLTEVLNLLQLQSGGGGRSEEPTSEI